MPCVRLEGRTLGAQHSRRRTLLGTCTGQTAHGEVKKRTQAATAYPKRAVNRRVPYKVHKESSHQKSTLRSAEREQSTGEYCTKRTKRAVNRRVLHKVHKESSHKVTTWEHSQLVPPGGVLAREQDLAREDASDSGPLVRLKQSAHVRTHALHIGLRQPVQQTCSTTIQANAP